MNPTILRIIDPGFLNQVPTLPEVSRSCMVIRLPRFRTPISMY